MSSPPDVQVLLAPENRSVAASAPDQALRGSQSAPGLDLSVLLDATAGDLELARALMGLFVEMAAPTFESLSKALATGDHARSQFESHALAGTTGLIGATALTALLKQMEIMAFRRQGDLATQLPLLEHAFRSALAAVRTELQDFDTPAGLPARVIGTGHRHE